MVTLPRWLRRWAAPTLLCSVAIVQWVEVEATGLTRWKGGGLGMYSEFHPTEYEIWLRLDGPDRDPQFEYLDDDEVQALVPGTARCLRHHQAQCLRALAPQVVGVSEPFSIQLWAYGLEGSRFRRRMVAEVASP